MKEEEILKVFATGKDTYRIKEEVTFELVQKEHIWHTFVDGCDRWKSGYTVRNR